MPLAPIPGGRRSGALVDHTRQHSSHLGRCDSPIGAPLVIVECNTPNHHEKDMYFRTCWAQRVTIAYLVKLSLEGSWRRPQEHIAACRFIPAHSANPQAQGPFSHCRLSYFATARGGARLRIFGGSWASIAELGQHAWARRNSQALDCTSVAHCIPLMLHEDCYLGGTLYTYRGR